MNEFLQKNWYLVVLALILVGAGFYGIVRPEPAEEPSELTQDVGNVTGTMTRSAWQQGTKSERADEDIAKMEAQLENNPLDPNTAAQLQNLGALYQYSKADYSTAASYYEDALDRFPDHPGNDPLYLRLAECYEKMGDRVLARDAYRRAVKNLSPEHEWHKFAAKKLAQEY